MNTYNINTISHNTFKEQKPKSQMTPGMTVNISIISSISNTLNNTF